MKQWIGHFVAAVAIAGLLFLRFGAGTENEGGAYPNKAVRIVVPFKAGGGSDTFARLIQKSVGKGEVINQPIVIMNQDGGSGTIGSRKVKTAKPDGYTFLCLHEGMMSAKYSGTVPYGPEAFDAVAQTGDIPMVVVVSSSSPHRSLSELMQAAKAAPGKLRFGTNIGAPPHFTARELEQAEPGAAFNYVQSGGGQKRYTLLIGDHIDLGLFSLAEYAAYKDDGKIRALAVLLAERHAGVPDVPTAVEQGVQVVASNAHFWWAPKGTAPARKALFAEALHAALQDPEVRERLDQLMIAPVFRDGAELDEYIAERNEAYAALSFGVEQDLPRFEYWVLGLVLLLGVLVLVFKQPEEKLAVERTGRPRKGLAVICLGLLCLYIVALQGLNVGFALSTFLFIMLCGGAMVDKDKRGLLVVFEIALVASLGLELVFTRVFGVPLW